MRVLLTIALALFAGQVYADSRTVFVQCQFSDGEVPIYRFRFNDDGIEHRSTPLEWSKWNASNGSWSPILEDSGYNSNKEKIMYKFTASEARFYTMAALYSPSVIIDRKKWFYRNSDFLRTDMNKMRFGSRSVPSINAFEYEVNRLTGEAVKSRLHLPGGTNSDGVFKNRVTQQVVATGQCEATAAPSPPPKPVTKF